MRVFRTVGAVIAVVLALLLVVIRTRSFDVQRVPPPRRKRVTGRRPRRVVRPELEGVVHDPLARQALVARGQGGK